MPRGRLDVIRLGVVLATLGLFARGVRAEDPGPSGEEFFETHVRPLLVARCFECHGESGKPKGGLRLTSRAGVLKGGDSGPAAVPGKPEESLLVEAVRYLDVPRMPPKARLDDREIEALARWVAIGLPWPDGDASRAGPPVGARGVPVAEEARRFWSFQPVRDVPPPTVRDLARARSGLDRFILSALEAKGLHPAPPADRRTLIRRATFDLTGLPPTPEEVAAFVADEAPDAFARVVDRLLASPRYGERWGRHWLDLVRYADSFDARGIGGEGDIAAAWRYRDWVVSAFNRDLPYDAFLTHQIAGDLLPPPEPGGSPAEGIVATGLLAIGNWGGGDADKEKLLTDIVDDQVDVVGRAFLGLTVACARCHDHKFDPIPTRDYYGLAGIFFSTHILPNVGPKTNGPPMLRIPLASKADLDRREQAAKRLAERERRLAQALDEAKASLARSLLPETSRYLAAAADHQAQRAGRDASSLPEFARARGLHEYALRQWLDALGLEAGYPLMTKPIRDVLGRRGIHAWKGEADCPSLTVNTGNDEAALLTFRLPPRSVAVHPGPTGGVAVAWTSPVSGRVRISGRLADADPAGGDGVAWTIVRRSASGVAELAGGAIANGGSMAFRGPELEEVELARGDRLELRVLPKAGHTCDTTVVALTIAERQGAAVWDLTADLVDAPLAGNPHPDRLGNRDAWRFEDMVGPAGPKPPTADAGRALAHWRRVVAESPDDRLAIDEAARAVAASFDQADSSSPFWIRAEADEPALPAISRETIAAIRAERDSLRAELSRPIPYAHGAQEGGVPGSPHAGVHDVRVHIRGSYSRLGELVPRHIPVLPGSDGGPPIASGSGRLELARWLARPDHVLTPRVMVNRIWQHHFGTGLVRTASNFGKLGERPTHPELLDHLATRFVAGGWSIKRMHREIMLSATYRQSSEAAPETIQADPDNRLFGRNDRRRLESEAIRDSLLAASGQLDATMGGPAVRDFDSGRRTLYLMTVRSDRSSFGPLFDAADPTAIVDARTTSTVAPQALFLLNNPFVLGQARAFARRLEAEADDDDARIERAYALLFARPPTADERAIGLASLAASGPSRRAWEEYCHVLLCTNEFLYVD